MGSRVEGVEAEVRMEEGVVYGGAGWLRRFGNGDRGKEVCGVDTRESSGLGFSEGCKVWHRLSDYVPGAKAYDADDSRRIHQGPEVDGVDRREENQKRQQELEDLHRDAVTLRERVGGWSKWSIVKVEGAVCRM